MKQMGKEYLSGHFERGSDGTKIIHIKVDIRQCKRPTSDKVFES